MEPYIPRTLENEILHLFKNPKDPKGLILAGIVGCGKTTLATTMLQRLGRDYAVFSFSSDDVQLRRQMTEDTTSLEKRIRSQTTRPALVFIDEIQKCEEAFDAVKYAYDQGNLSFIISGSNPGFLNTTARKRLQRRAHFMTLHPLSPAEICAHQMGISLGPYDRVITLMSGEGWQWIKDLPPIDITPSLRQMMESYIRFGGLPGVWRQQDSKAKLMELQSVAERGFYPLSEDTQSLADIIRVALAQMNGREFTYATIFQKARTDKRYKINAVIDELVNQGYLFKKTPRLFHPSKSSYLFILSWIDPGFVHYFTGVDPWQEDRGAAIESVIHTALVRIAGLIPTKTEVSYFKPYVLDINHKVKYQPGEIDFLFQRGNSIVPIEVKATADIGSIDTSHLRRFLNDRKAPYGIVCYGGVPYVDVRQQIIYWPYWWV